MGHKMTLLIEVYGDDTDELMTHLQAITNHLDYRPAGIDFYAKVSEQTDHPFPVHMGVDKKKRPRKVGNIHVQTKGGA